MEENKPELQPGATQRIKLAMTMAIIMFTAMAFFLFGEREPNEEDVSMLQYLFGVLAVIASVIGFSIASKARREKTGKEIVAAATFETVALLGFIYVILDSEAPLWIVAAGSTYAIAMIWLVVPNQSEHA